MTPLRPTRTLAVIVIMTLFALSCGGTATTGVTATAPAIAPTEPAELPPTTATASPQPADTEAIAPPTPAPPSTVEPAPEPTATPAPVALPTGIVPTHIEIAAIGVDAPTIGLNLSGAEPEVPSNFGDTGWYTQTRLPGEIGPAVIAGHIDSRSGPAVFAELDQLVAGDEVVVYDDAGDRRVFVVVAADQYPKGDLPPSVFGFGEPEPELRLITCGGTFDQSTGHYRDNYVVFARLIS